MSRLALALASVVLLVVTAGCASPTSTSSAAPARAKPAAESAPKPVEGLVEVGDGVLAWVSSPWTFSTTSYAIDAPGGLILIDTQFLPKEGLAFVDAVENHTGKKAVAAFVLHANPDKFNGTAAFQERGIRVLTSKEVADLIPAVHEKRVKAFGKRYAPDYPTSPARPELVAGQGSPRQILLAGTALNVWVMGPGCSAAHIVVEHKGDVFAGDLVANGSHAWLEIGETLEWQKRLDEMSALKPRRVMPGRGLPGGPELLANQRAYLDDVVAAVAAQKPSGEPSDAGLAAAKTWVVAKHPTLRFSVFLEIGLPAEWRRQAGLATKGHT